MFTAVKQRTFFCGMPSFDLSDLVNRWWYSRTNPCDWPQFAGRSVIFTYRGRVSIAFICRYWGLGPEDEVLIPAYNCGTEVDPVLWCGAKVVLYRVDRQANADWQDVRRRITDRTRVLYITHYFGWPQQVNEIADFCRQRGIRILEDCALSLFSMGSEGPVGVMGDAAVFSFPKTLPVPDGGALTTQEEIPEARPILQTPPNMEILWHTLPLIKRALIRKVESAGLYGLVGSKLAKSLRRQKIRQDGEFPDMPQSYYFDEQIANWGPSMLSLKLLTRCNPQTIVETRRKNYQALFDALRDVPGLGFLFAEIPEGVCPLGLPVLVDSRQKWLSVLNKLGIAVIPWGSLSHPRLSWDEFPEARFLKDHLLMLPIHQQMGLQHINYMAECVKGLVFQS